jgi:hypothetical protein
MIVHMNVHKNKKMLGTIKSTCERPEIQDVNVFNSISKIFMEMTNFFHKKRFYFILKNLI